MNCAVIAPNRPTPLINEVAEPRLLVGNDSDEMTPNAFHAEVAQALKAHATTTIVVADPFVLSAKKRVEIAAANIDPANNRFRPMTSMT